MATSHTPKRSTPSHPKSENELRRLSRRPLAGTGAVSTRSKSAPGVRHKIAQPDALEAGPRITIQHCDPSSRGPWIPMERNDNIPVGNDDTYARRGPSSARTNSDPTSATSDDSQSADEWDERNVNVPRSNLTELDVAALILNKMVGTGIFTTPGAVLAFTKSKAMSVALWTVGGLWTGLFLLVYLEFANALPFNGGELVYLDEIYRRPELLATVLFSGYFITLQSSYGNGIQFAKHVLLAANGDVSYSTELDPRLVRYIAVSVVTLVCLIHYFSARAGLFLNKVLASYKVVLLVVVFSAGFSYSNKHGSLWNDPTAPSSASSLDGLSAMVSIFYTYQGWENANYVAGEIRALEGRTPTRTLKVGAFLAVGTVWVLYVLVSVAYYRVLDYATITDSRSDLGVAPYFAPKVFGSSLGIKVCMAISALGNVLAVTYTSAKVKQTIAIQRFLPFWRFLIRDDDTPKGALVLHWIVTVLMIALCPTNSDGYNFAIGIATYGHIFFSMFVALGLWGLKRRMSIHHHNYRLTIFREKAILYTISIIFALGNLLVLIFSAKPRLPGKIPRYWWPITLFLVLLGSFLYWVAMSVTRVKVKFRGEERTVGDIFGLEVKVYHKDTKDVPSEMKDSIAEALAAKIDGSRRRVEFKTSGWIAKVGTALTKTRDFLARWLF